MCSCGNDVLLDYIKKSYKKLKGWIYLDKTQLPLVKKVVEYESKNNYDLETSFRYLADNLVDDNKWNIFSEKIIDSIDVLVYPKQIIDNNPNEVISNFESNCLKLGKVQYFISLAVEGHILSMIWLLTVGYYLDSKCISKCAYGNRLIEFDKEKIVNNSPYIFKTYFSQYNLWRDSGIRQAKENLSNKDDIYIVLLDFKSFYYSIDIEKNWFENILSDDFKKNNTCNIDFKIIEKIHNFIFKILKNYSNKVHSINNQIKVENNIDLAKRIFLPIGFIPSNILSNYYLKELDELILKKIKPVFYGRYVDDIIIVDKISHNKEIQEIINKEDKKNIINCVIGKDIVRDNIIKSEILHCGGNPVIEFQTQKVQLFCLNHKMPFTVLDSFVKQVDKSTSEFRFLPDLDDMLNRNDYSEIYNLVYKDTPNKFKFASNINLDKFSLSKFLGKYRKIGSLIDDSKEERLIKDLINLLDNKTLIENYTLWERLLQIMVVDNYFDKYFDLVAKIINSIEIYEKDNGFADNISNALWLVLESSIYRTISLCRGDNVRQIIENINSFNDFIKLDYDEIHKYCHCRMINNYILPLPIDFFINFDNEKNINLTKFEDVFDLVSNIKNCYDDNYVYYPYILRPQDIAFALFCFNIYKVNINSEEKQYNQIYEIYKKKNGFEHSNIEESINIKPLTHYDIVDIKSSKQDKFKIAIANTILDDKNLKNSILGTPNRSIIRYDQLSHIVRIALKEKADLLIFPESYLPLEWLPVISRICANNQLSIITGIEHISCPSIKKMAPKTKILNMTSIILPYKEGEYKYSYVTFHLKKHYSPEEKNIIKGYRCEYLENSNKYKLFHWKDLWFSVYCCFDLASLKDRSLFLSIADMIVAVEWNKDLYYFNSIIESLSRDLHCYCIQVNSSNYGDSRIVQPTHKISSDIIRTKGGINSTALIGEINIKSLRDFQMKEYNLQKEDDSFKPTPPDFKTEYIIAKQNNCLLDILEKNDLETNN